MAESFIISVQRTQLSQLHIRQVEKSGMLHHTNKAPNRKQKGACSTGDSHRLAYPLTSSRGTRCNTHNLKTSQTNNKRASTSSSRIAEQVMRIPSFAGMVGV